MVSDDLNGEMAEWTNAAVSKTVVRHPPDRGFESPSLRTFPLKVYTKCPA